MGNKLCKKKTEGAQPSEGSSKSPFDRIITRLHLRPNSWKSESDLNRKQLSKSRNAPPVQKSADFQQNRLSKSCDWTDADLSVPDEPVQLRNPKLELIFNDNSTPIPPPRKHRHGIRERFEAVARSGLQAFQGKKPVDEPLCVKKTYDYGCPLDDHGHKKEMKRKKNLSVVSLPNYNDLKFTLAKTEADVEKSSNTSNPALPTEPKTLMTRCRSFGSLLPQQLLHKLKSPKAPADVESDDSFGPLEDWDLRIIEHYNPKDASLPRPRKPVPTTKDVQSDVEGLIVSQEEAERPVAPVRRSESLLKKMNRKAAEAATMRRSAEGDRAKSVTPPSSPVEERKKIQPTNFPTSTPDGKVEHSNLLKLLEDFSVLDKQSASFELDPDIPYIEENATEVTSESSSLTPSLVEFEKTLVTAVEDFINTERAYGAKELPFGKNLSLPQNAIATKT